jgi:hypothetical protein
MGSRVTPLKPKKYSVNPLFRWNFVYQISKVLDKLATLEVPTVTHKFFLCNQSNSFLVKFAAINNRAAANKNK